jgi:hypothetical protein
MSDERMVKPKYTSPVIVPLGDLVAGIAAVCTDGSGASSGTPSCGTGSRPHASGSGFSCGVGNVASGCGSGNTATTYKTYGCSVGTVVT